jgi:hypothetical protein
LIIWCGTRIALIDIRRSRRFYAAEHFDKCRQTMPTKVGADETSIDDGCRASLVASAVGGLGSRAARALPVTDRLPISSGLQTVPVPGSIY